jgi:hypothetical protein
MYLPSGILFIPLIPDFGRSPSAEARAQLTFRCHCEFFPLLHKREAIPSLYALEIASLASMNASSQ